MTVARSNGTSWRMKVRRAVSPGRPPSVPPCLACRLDPALVATFDEALAQHPDLPLAFVTDTPLPGMDAYQPRGSQRRSILHGES
jgi:hypothetical protein